MIVLVVLIVLFLFFYFPILPSSKDINKITITCHFILDSAGKHPITAVISQKDYFDNVFQIDKFAKRHISYNAFLLKIPWKIKLTYLLENGKSVTHTYQGVNDTVEEELEVLLMALPDIQKSLEDFASTQKDKMNE